MIHPDWQQVRYQSLSKEIRGIAGEDGEWFLTILASSEKAGIMRASARSYDIRHMARASELTPPAGKIEI